MNDKRWYSLTTSQIYNELKTNEKGLTTEEIKVRQEKYGKNILPKGKTDSIFKIMFNQLIDPIIILLIATIVFSLVINETMDAIAIAFILLVDLVMGTFQEWKAEKNAEALANIIKEKVKVIRDGVEHIIDSSELVVGDIVLLESGNKISADLKIIEEYNLTINESILTGESVNVVKSVGEYFGEVPLADQKNMAFSGTSVITGRAKCVVISTGVDTEIGKIAYKVSSTKKTKSPLTIRMEKFSKQITFLIIAIAIVIAILLYIKGTPGNDIFLLVIALSVSAMPEGLPLALTMALTIASNRMAKKEVIVKKLNSVESLGSCTVIASDKTGTLTVNEQTAKKILLPTNEEFSVGGTGYLPKGKVTGNNLELAYDIAKLGMINNEASYEEDEEQFFGDSIDIAFLVLAKKMNVKLDDIEIIGSIPYESENKFSALFYKKHGKYYCTVKGSIEKIISFSNKMNETDQLNRELLINQNEDLASDGYRVIAIANGELKGFKEKEEYTINDIDKLTFKGLVAFIDPIREEVKKSISECKTAGIKVAMVTGDHPLTALAIAKELGLANDISEVAIGTEVAEYFKKGQKSFDEYVKDKRVFARVTPLDKLEIVESYKRQGEFVSVTGDGVNDAPAIKAANIGIAMGSGTDVAKETAAMIIANDNFTSIVTGVKEGRNAYSNIRKISYMLLSCSFAEVLFFILSIIFNLPMPLVAIQLLWLNIVTDGLQDFALSFEKAEDNIMNERPRKTNESLFNAGLLKEVLIAGLSIGLIVFGVWVYLIKGINMDPVVARGYVMALMVFMQNMHVLNCKSEKQSIFKVSMKSNPMVLIAIISSIVLQVIIMEVPLLSGFLQTTSISVTNLIILFLFSTLILFIMEIYKKINNRKKL